MDVQRINSLPFMPGRPAAAPAGGAPAVATVPVAPVPVLNPINEALQPVGSPGRRWQDAAAKRIGVDLTKWDPKLPFASNRDRVWRSYDYYRTMQLDHPNLKWLGMAYGMAPTFGSALEDLSVFHTGVDNMQRRVNRLPAPMRDAVNGAIQLTAGTPLKMAADTEQLLQKMQRAIFLDQSMQHEAYVGGGMPAIRELEQSGAIDEFAVKSWEQIDAGTRTGNRALLEAGSLGLLRREQLQTIADDYDAMRSDTKLSPLMTKVISAIGRPLIPGARSAADISPVHIGPFEGPLSEIDVSKREERWAMIEHDTWPAYRRLVNETPARFDDMLHSSLDQRIADGHFRMLPDSAKVRDLLRFATRAL
jgi:hypothetical protein